jgi:hypothetical protein
MSDLKPTLQHISEIIEITEKLRAECKNPLDAPKVGKAELAAIIKLVKDTCREPDAPDKGQVINAPLFVPDGVSPSEYPKGNTKTSNGKFVKAASDLFEGPFTPTKMERQLSSFSIRGLIKFRRLLLRPQNLKSKDQSVIRELLNIDSLAKSVLEKKIREAARERWKQNGHPLAVNFCRKLKPWRAYLLSLGYKELAALDIGDIYPQLSVGLCESYSNFLLSKGDSPDSLLNPIIGQLWLVMDNRVAEIKAEDEQKATGTNTSPLSSLKNPVTCAEVGGIIRKRSDNIAAELKKHRYPVVKSNRKNYCNAEDAAVLWPKWKRHCQSQEDK